MTAESEAAHAVAQSLAEDVLATLAGESDGLPPGEPWHALGLGEGAVASGTPRSAAPFPARLQLDSPVTQLAAAQVAAEAADSELRADLVRMEELLAERSIALRDAHVELEQLRALGRDTAARFGGLPDAAVELVRARVERDRAAARAIEAEAGRAELAFRLDEVRGHMLTAGRAEGGLPGEAVQTTCARLAGTVRGLLAARAEAEERRDIGWARALLLEQDLEDARIVARSLERDLAEAHEQHELAQVEARALAGRLAGVVDARVAAELRGETLGLRARGDEAERALALAVARGAQLSAGSGAELAAAQARIAEFQRALARETENRAEAESLLAKGEAERLVLGAQVERAQADLAQARAELGAELDATLAAKDAQLEQLRGVQRRELERLSEARAVVERLSAERSRAHGLSTATLHEVRTALAELASAVEQVMRQERATEPGAPSPFDAADG